MAWASVWSAAETRRSFRCAIPRPARCLRRFPPFRISATARAHHQRPWEMMTHSDCWAGDSNVATFARARIGPARP